MEHWWIKLYFLIRLLSSNKYIDLSWFNNFLVSEDGHDARNKQEFHSDLLSGVKMNAIELSQLMYWNRNACIGPIDINLDDLWYREGQGVDNKINK